MLELAEWFRPFATRECLKETQNGSRLVGLCQHEFDIQAFGDVLRLSSMLRVLLREHREAEAAAHGSESDDTDESNTGAFPDNR